MGGGGVRRRRRKRRGGGVFFFFKQKTAYEMLRSLVGSEMCIRGGRPAPAMLPVPSQPQWGSPEHNWDRPPSPPRPDSRPAPPGFAPPRARSRCAAHLHHGLPVSPAPTPGSRRASGTSLPPPGETGGQSIQPTEAIQAV